MPSTNAPETTTRILDAVMHLILQAGLPAVTLSAVCRQAGLSKGGLMHHYPTKESLVDAFLDRAVRDYFGFIHQAVEQHPCGLGLRAKAIVDLLLGDPHAFEPGAKGDCAAVMVALIQGGRDKAQVGEFYRTFLQIICDDGLSLDLAELIVATLDGVWLQSMIEANATLVPRAGRIHQQLHQMIRCEMEGTPELIARET